MSRADERVPGVSRRWRTGAAIAVAAVAMFLISTPARPAVEVTVVQNTPGQQQVKGELVRMDPDGTVTIKVQTGELSFAKGQYKELIVAKPPAFDTAEALYREKKYDLALARYQTVYEQFQFLTWGAKALLGAANCQRNLEQWQKAADTYAKYLGDFPSGADVTAAVYYQGTCFGRLGNPDKMYSAMQHVAQSSDNVYTVYALMQVADIQYKRSQPDDALLSYLKVAILYSNWSDKSVQEKVKQAKQEASRIFKEKAARATSETERRKFLKSASLVLR